MPLLPENRVIQSLWIGTSLSAMEQLGITSHVARRAYLGNAERISLDRIATILESLRD